MILYDIDMNPIYCLSCRRKTSTRNAKIVKKNKRYIETGMCSVCNTRKSTFLPTKKRGSGLLGNVLGQVVGNMLPF